MTPTDTVAPALQAKGMYLGTPGELPRSAVVFPGHGAQYVDMLADLYESHPVVRETLDRIDDAYRSRTGHTLTSRMFSGGSADPETTLADPEVMQPAIFAASLALFRVLESAGHRPDLLVGHSLGELSALVAAGALSIEDGLAAVHARGCAVKVVAPEHRGAMLSVRVETAAERAVLDRLLLLTPGSDGYAVRSVVNSPEQTVVSGDHRTVEALAEACGRRGLKVWRLPVSHGFHSRLLAPAVPLLEAELARLTWSVPRVPVLSGVFGGRYEPADLPDLPALLARQLVTPFSFQDLIEQAYAAGIRLFVEAGPKSILSGLVSRILRDRDVLVVATNVPAFGGVESLRRAEAALAVWLPGRYAAGTTEPVAANGSTAHTANGSTAHTANGSTAHTANGGVAHAANGGSAATSAAGAATRLDAELERELLHIVSRQTGYPVAMLGVDQRMVADLGFSPRVREGLVTALAGRLNVPVGEVPTSDGTLGELFAELLARANTDAGQSAGGAAETADAATAPAPTATSVPEERLDQIREEVLAVVQAKTGYPPDLLEGDLDLEADLGIDSVKQVEILAELRTVLSLGPDVELPAKDLNTLDRIVAELATLTAGPAAAEPAPAPAEPPVAEPVLAGVSATAAAGTAAEPAPAAASDGAGPVPSADTAEPVPTAAASDGAELVPPVATREIDRVARRYVPVLVRRDLPEGTRVDLSDSTVVVVPDPGGAVSGALLPRLTDAGARVLLVDGELGDPERTAEAFARVTAPADRPLTVLNLYGLGGSRFQDPGADWPAHVDAQFTVNLLAAKAYHADLSRGAGHAYVAVTRAGDAAGRATAGFVKSLALELPAIRATVIDLDPDDPERAAGQIIDELTAPPGTTVEVRYAGQRRHIVQVVPHELDWNPRQRGVGLRAGDVVVFTGGGRGITYECAAGLAEVPGVHLVLLGRTAPPAGDEPWLTMTDQEFAGYREDFLRGYKQANPGRSLADAQSAFARVAAARELHQNLTRLRARNPLVRYEVCDVADGEQVRAVVARVRAELGPITGAVHGAGLESINPVPRKHVGYARQVLRVKAGGAYALWHAVAADRPRFFVLFGSILGRFGMDGQVDYAAGADLMSAVSAELAADHPETRSFTLAWTAWSDTGMAASAAVRRIQEQQRRLRYISVEEGVQAFVRELCYGGREPEVLVFGDTGLNDLGGQDAALTADQRGVATPFAADGWLIDRVRLPLLDRVTHLDDRTVRVTRPLDPEVDRYLADHRVRGTGTVPAVLHVEAHAEAASLLVPGESLIGVEDVELLRFIKPNTRFTRVLTVAAELAQGDTGGHRVAAELRSELIGPDGRPLDEGTLHSRAVYRFSPTPPPVTPAGFTVRELTCATGTELSLDLFYRHTADHISFGPTFRHVQRVWTVGEREVASLVRVPDNRWLLASASDPYLRTAPVLIDNAWRSLLMWAYHELGELYVPISIGSIDFHRPALPGEPVYCRSAVTKVDGSGDDRRLYVDTQLVNADDELVCDIRGLIVVCTGSVTDRVSLAVA